MRWVLAAAALLLCRPATATYVDHEMIPQGIVAISVAASPMVLDRYGQTWEPPYAGVPEWQRHEAFDVPLPVEQIRFWEVNMLVTVQGEAYTLWNGVWTNGGIVPSASGVATPGVSVALDATVIPNPTPGAAELSFSIDVPTDVSAWILDASGRVVRHLLDDNLPAGEHRIAWDGRDDRGEALPAGVYFSRVRAGGGDGADCGG